MANFPYFPFYPDDWLSSPKVMVDMDDSERGIYITLLAVAWHLPDCTLPASIDKCRKLCRAKRAVKVEKVLRLCFTQTENGWRNERELNENRHASDKHNKAVLAGKASANKRLHSTSAERPLQRPLNLPDPEPEEPYTQSPKKPPRKPGKPANPSVRVLQEYLSLAFEKKFGSAPVMSYPAIGKQLRVLLDKERFTEDALKDLIDWFLTSPKAQDHPTPAAAISTDTVQRWMVACPEVK